MCEKLIIFPYGQ